MKFILIKKRIDRKLKKKNKKNKKINLKEKL